MKENKTDSNEKPSLRRGLYFKRLAPLTVTPQMAQLNNLFARRAVFATRRNMLLFYNFAFVTVTLANIKIPNAR